MTIVVLRFFFIYGPGQRRTMLMPRLVDNVRRERPIVLQGEHGIRLNPVFADDAAAAVEAAAGLNHSETINVAGPQVLSLREIATRIGEAVGREPCFQAQPGADAKHLIGNTDKMVRLLGAPRIGLVEGIRRMLAADKS
jgi:nucleoside-diphosphate-sugar epimerase